MQKLKLQLKKPQKEQYLHDLRHLKTVAREHLFLHCDKQTDQSVSCWKVTLMLVESAGRLHQV